MQSSDLLSSPSAPLVAELKERTNKLLSRILRANHNTQFAQGASEVAEFCQAAADLFNGTDDDSLCDVFRKKVFFTTYDTCAPFVAKFLEKPCKADSVVDLFAPGLPDYLALSSSTSGGSKKYFPKYNFASSTPPSSDARSHNDFDPSRKRTATCIKHLWTTQIDVEDDKNCLVKKLNVCTIGVVHLRSDLNLDPEHDEEKMGTFIFDHTAPLAVTFIGNWRTFLLIQGLFAIASRSLETMATMFISTFVEMIRYIDVEFDMVVDSIEHGTIPNLPKLEGIRRYLEPNFLPDPERAAELRALGRPSDCRGWCKHVWPSMRSVSAISSGSFASYVPLALSYLGPDVDLCPGYYGSTEASIGLPYSSRELNMYRFTSRLIIEFLDVEKDMNSISSLAQMWEVETGKRYEIVVTTKDGLWRYRMGDVIEIAGFDSKYGPIMKFVERSSVLMRFETFMLTEKDLRDAAFSAILSIPGIKVCNWTTTMDDRELPSTVGFFVELSNDEVPDLMSSAADRISDELLKTAPQIAFSLRAGFFRRPTIRLVRTGTFSDFLQLKLDEGSQNVGQVKVPVVLPKAEYVTWFSNHVVREL